MDLDPARRSRPIPACLPARQLARQGVHKGSRRLRTSGKRPWWQTVESDELLALQAQIEHRVSVTFLATDLDQTFSFVQPRAEPMPRAVFPQAPSSPTAR